MFDNETPFIPLEIAQYKEMRDTGTDHLLLDVREAFEYAQAHIADSTLIPMNDVMERADELREYERIVVVCQTGSRSAMVAMALRDAGLTGKIYNLEGGIVAWANQGNPYVTGAE